MILNRKAVLIILSFALSGILGFLLSYYQYSAHKTLVFSEDQTIETFHYPALLVKQLEGDKEAGMKIFHEFCAACHSKEPQIDIQAPRIGDKKFWRLRAQAGMKVLLATTQMGRGAMPARGGCFECSDAQLLEAIRYILQNS